MGVVAAPQGLPGQEISPAGESARAPDGAENPSPSSEGRRAGRVETTAARKASQLHPTVCETLDREKWLWHGWYEDYLPPFMSSQERPLPEASFGTCWQCCLWPEASWPPVIEAPPLPPREALKKAQCYEFFGMQGAALGAYRSLLASDPSGEEAPACVAGAVSLYFLQGNAHAATAFFDSLPAALRENATPETLYALGQGCYHQKRYGEALSYFSRVPKTSDFYPYVLYTQVQIAFHDGDVEKAETGLRALAFPEEGVQAPDMLRDLSRLTLARILYDQGKYPEAAGAFRELRQSQFYLVDALTGIGWCYEAMEEPVKAISYFQAAEEASYKNYRDSLASLRAGLEKGRLYAAQGMHSDASWTFKYVQLRMENYAAFLDQYASSDEWVARQAAKLLQEGRGLSRLTPPTDMPAEMREFEEEAAQLLRKQSYLSPRIQELYTVRDSLHGVEDLLESVPVGAPEDPSSEGLTPATYPPLQTTDAILGMKTVHLLDSAMALLDTEYRLEETTANLELVSPEERKTHLTDTNDFYRTSFRKILHFTPDDRRIAHEAIDRTMSIVRHVPGSLEDREVVMQKLLSMKQSLADADETLARWDRAMQDAVDAGSPAIQRPAMLDLWTVYIRTLVYLKNWPQRSPSVFLLPGLVPIRIEGIRLAPVDPHEGGPARTRRRHVGAALRGVRGRGSFHL